METVCEIQHSIAIFVIVSYTEKEGFPRPADIHADTPFFRQRRNGGLPYGQCTQKAAPKERIDLSERLRAKLLHNFSVQPEAATNENFYHALALVLRDLMRTRRLEYIGDCYQQQSKQVYYLCMEFLMGRSLKTPCTI